MPLESNSDPVDLSAIQRPATAEPEKGNEFAYNPADRPDEYPQVEADKELAHELFLGDEGFGGKDYCQL